MFITVRFAGKGTKFLRKLYEYLRIEMYIYNGEVNQAPWKIKRYSDGCGNTRSFVGMIQLIAKGGFSGNCSLEEVILS